MPSYTNILKNPLFQRANQQAVAKAQSQGLALPQMATKGIMGAFAADEMQRGIASQRFATQRFQDLHGLNMRQQQLDLANKQLKWSNKLAKKQYQQEKSELRWSIPMGLGTLGVDWYFGQKDKARSAARQKIEDQINQGRLAEYKAKGYII